MKNLKFSTKILVVSIFILVIFSLASFGILFRALSNQASREMDQLLKNESLALSALVNLGASGFEFEMQSNFLSQYRQRNPHGFFRFIDPESGKAVKESEQAPNIGCAREFSNISVRVFDQSYRVETLLFHPEFDGEPQPTSRTRPLCLVVGIDREPYWNVLVETLLSSIPILISIFVILVIALLVLIRGLTRDLRALTSALTTANFGGTHAFPTLPKANTQEVKAIIEVLEELHRQASEVYREMWLFMGRAAHQIKTPVTAMQATLEVLLRRDRTKDELLGGLADVQSAAGLLNELTRKLISSSRISYQESPPTEPINLQSFFKELVELFKSKANESGVELRIETDLSLNVLGNRSLMSDIFGNLIENAILYSPEHKNASIHLAWHTEGNSAVIEISDQGIGFPDAVRLDLFKPFVRGDERKAVGSGLGLSIAKKSVNLLRGEIELAESSPRGSRMRVWLPLSF